MSNLKYLVEKNFQIRCSRIDPLSRNTKYVTAGFEDPAGALCATPLARRPALYVAHVDEGGGKNEQAHDPNRH